MDGITFKKTPVEFLSSRAVDVHVLRNTFLQTGHRHDDLECRARGELRLQGFVQKRLGWVSNEPVPLCPRDADRERVRIKGRPAGHGQDLPVAGIDRHHCAVMPLQRLFHGNLQV